MLSSSISTSILTRLPRRPAPVELGVQGSFLLAPTVIGSLRLSALIDRLCLTAFPSERPGVLFASPRATVSVLDTVFDAVFEALAGEAVLEGETRDQKLSESRWKMAIRL